MSDYGEEALAKHAPISELVATYRSAAADIRSACELLSGAQERMKAAFKLGNLTGFCLKGRYRVLEIDAEDILENLKRETWWAIVERLEIKRLLSVKRAQELDSRLRDGDLPEITEKTISDFAGFYVDHQRDMLEEAVNEVFDWLRPVPKYGRRVYKTNSEFEVGAKVILENMVEPAWISHSKFRVCRDQQLTALDNVFSMLDGKGSIAKTYNGPLHDAITASETGVGETEYFAFRCCKNKNLHLEFKRLDLLKRFNMVAGNKRLRAA